MTCRCQRHFVCHACLFGPMPVVRVDGTLLFPGGESRPATDDENARLDAGLPVTVDVRSGAPTELVGAGGY